MVLEVYIIYIIFPLNKLEGKRNGFHEYSTRSSFSLWILFGQVIRDELKI